jgi:uncharacterized protein YjbI with pentapeptide repeats
VIPFRIAITGQTEKFKLPPIDFNDQNRCVLKSSKIGQANAARDKLYDLRMCKLQGAKAVGFDLSGVIMTQTDLSNADLKDAYFSKGFLQGKLVTAPFELVAVAIGLSRPLSPQPFPPIDSKFDGADFSNGISKWSAKWCFVCILSRRCVNAH